jgi:hypothetical protein
VKASGEAFALYLSPRTGFFGVMPEPRASGFLKMIAPEGRSKSSGKNSAGGCAWIPFWPVLNRNTELL